MTICVGGKEIESIGVCCSDCARRFTKNSREQIKAIFNSRIKNAGGVGYCGICIGESVDYITGKTYRQFDLLSNKNADGRCKDFITKYCTGGGEPLREISDMKMHVERAWY